MLIEQAGFTDWMSFLPSNVTEYTSPMLIEQAGFTDWMSFLPSNVTEYTSPNPDTLHAKF